MADFRIEHDFLGNKEVPAEAYYGAQTMRAVENFPITGDRLHPTLIKCCGIVKKACALANAECGVMDKKIGEAIAAAADEVIAGKMNEWFVVDPIQGGAGTSINMNTNEVIANRAIEILGGKKGDYKIVHPNDHVNMAQSTNDAFPTAAHLALAMLIDDLLAAMKTMRETMLKKSREFDGMIKMGRTHLQDAVPIRLGQEFAAHAAVVGRDIERIGRTKEHLYSVNIGGSAVGTGLNANPEYIKLAVRMLAEFSGLPIVGAENMIDGTQNCDAYSEVSAALKVCMINMSKICNDLRLMASGPRCGLSELNLPPRQPGSSIMPGKINPVMAEVVNQVAFQVIGNDIAVTMGVEAGQFELNVMEPVFVYNTIKSLQYMRNVFTVFTRYLLEGLTANAERMSSYVENSVGTITAINPHVGYEVAAKLAREATQSRRPVRELIIEQGILTKDEVAVIMDPMNMTSPGISGYEIWKKKRGK